MCLELSIITIIENRFLKCWNEGDIYLVNIREIDFARLFIQFKNEIEEKINALSLLNHTHASVSHFGKPREHQEKLKGEHRINIEEAVRIERDTDTSRVRCSSSPSTSI